MFFAPLCIPPRARSRLFCIGLAVLAVASGPQVQAATIYQCKQAGGGVAFQEKPCAPSDAQSVLKPTTRTAPAQAAPAAQASRGTPAAPAATLPTPPTVHAVRINGQYTAQTPALPHANRARYLRAHYRTRKP